MKIPPHRLALTTPRTWLLLLAGILLTAFMLVGFAMTPDGTGCKPGLSELDLPNGGHYCGQMQNGKLDGQGRIDWNERKTYYEGQFAHGYMEGNGHLVSPRSEYIGQFHHGYMDGQGRLTRGKDMVYEGSFVNGAMQGQGKLTRGKDWGYEGAFANDRMQGRGKLTMGDYVYEGQFENDKFTGQGRLIYVSGATIEGRFENFQTVGPMLATWPSGERFEGPLKHNRPDGEGVWTRPDKAVVRGKFEGFDLDGDGSIEYPDGSRYTGPIDEWQAQGKGELRRANGDVYVGGFAADKFDGKGTLTQKDGVVRAGYWRAGKYLGAQDDGTLEDTREVMQHNLEAVLYNQPALLQRQWDQLQPSPAGAGAPQMYALLIAGEGRQEVFRREVAFVDDLFERRFGTRGHTVTLVNSRSSAERLPLATEHSIELALHELAQKMDPQRDLLFVFFTSHGSHTHELSLGMGGMMLPSLPEQQLADLLKASGIRNQIVVVSACYSGGIVPMLQGERTWVITAARADRTSFGCADDNDFTYFGRALFKEALPAAPTLSAAFERADQLVAEWENKDDDDAGPWSPIRHWLGAALAASAANEADAPEDHRSHPQSSVSPAFRAEVDAWFQAHPGGGAR